ncbi:hypothetical protein [Streptomyces europaeiscabiei]|uniref:hypothetical protein n=1 Tax=Streptomyces europaeiscabiei TaxID=146819 RepID=UPI0029B18A0F|nr:hypothetical protein [Streptomyces europaeiscabiei]MDX2757918.1 hypothetical protein [Streptomyces europaeiscabiei]MDX3549513.1 hypothetical protein [Streptomyces europaeiscabiei]
MAIPGNFLSVTTETVDPNTSGWAAKLNCTLTLGTGGRSGDGCVQMKSTASGEMQARTYSSYAVTPAETYWAFADASGTSVPERIGIRWLNASGTEISITWSLTTAAASASWHRISVGGVAPAGAARAQVLVSATAGAGNQNTFFENVYLGYPLRFALNLLSFDAEQLEINGAAWAVETNCSLSRTAPVVSWPEYWYYAGGEVLTLTVTSNGNASALCVERPAVEPGTEYLGYAYINPPTSGSSCWIELRFYNGAGTQIQATRSVLAAPGTGWYRQIASAVAPAGAASASLAIGITSGTAAQVVRTEGIVLKVRTTTTISSIPEPSVVLYADSGFEQGVGQWTVPSGVATIARSTPWGAQMFVETYSLTVTSSTATASTIRSGQYAVTGGVNWRLSAGAKRTAGGWTLAASIRWLDAGSSLISTTSSVAAGIPSDGLWYVLQQDFTAPANAAFAQIDYTLTATSGSSTLQLDEIELLQVLPATAVTVDDATASAQLTLREINTSHLMTVYRVLADGARTLVRGPSGLIDQLDADADTYIVTDYEAPLGVPFSYRIEFYSSSTGALAAWRTTSVFTLDPGDINYAWLKDPLRPQLNRRVLVKQAPDWQQPIEQSIMRLAGRQNAVVLSRIRSGREGSLTVWTQSDDERESLRFLLATGNVLLWQSAPGMGEPDIYVSVAQTSLPRVSAYAPESWREWQLPLTEVDRPTGGTMGSATWTVRDVGIENASVLSLISRYATVLDLALDQRTGG